MKKKEIKEVLNKHGSLKEPFFFMLSYDLCEYEILPLKDIYLHDIKYEFNNNNNFKNLEKIDLEKKPICFFEYKKAFNKIQDHIKKGNSYLSNLTFKTQINTTLSLEEIYKKSKAKFKLKYKDKFVCFSPEKFIEIKKNKIFTYPMKGTINANIVNAQAKILGNSKEMSEHIMIVDLLRNDLSMVSSKVKVDKFRYCEQINTGGDTKLLGVSSKIHGNLDKNWNKKIGDILTTLLPAGSITGTPKKKTIEILNSIENYKRDYYTGIAGIYDGQCLYSYVLIRFIEKEKNQLYYKSGGGITSDSNEKMEYQELIDKIYIPS